MPSKIILAFLAAATIPAFIWLALLAWQIIFIALKLSSVLSWSWPLILFPLWIFLMFFNAMWLYWALHT
jgi:hypothetical protein